MNIQPVKSEGLVTPPKTKTVAPKSARQDAATDVFQPEQNAKLMETLRNEPDIRPDQVAKGRALVDDPSYPSNDVLAGIAAKLLGEDSSN